MMKRHVLGVALALVFAPLSPAIGQSAAPDSTQAGGHGLQYQVIVNRIAAILGVAPSARATFLSSLVASLRSYLDDAVVMADKHMMLGDPMDVTLLIKSNAIRLEFPEGYARFLVSPAPEFAVTYDGIYFPVIIMPDEAPRMMRVIGNPNPPQDPEQGG